MNNSIILFGSLIINPILSIFMAMRLKIDIKKHYIFIAAFMGYIAMLLEPSESYKGIISDDISRHYLWFESYNINISFIDYLKSRGKLDFIVPLEYFLGNLFGIKKEIIPFISTFIAYYCILRIFYVLFGTYTIRNINFLFIIFILLVNFKQTALGIRYYPSLYITMYGIFVYFYDKKLTKALFILLMASMFHSAMLFIAVMFLSFLLINKISDKIFVALLFASVIFSCIPNFMYNVLEAINTMYTIIPQIYIDGLWANNFLSYYSLNTKIVLYSELGLKILFIIYTVIFMKIYSFNKKIYYFFIYAFSLVILLIDFFSIFLRYIDFIFILSFVLWFIYLKKQGDVIKFKYKIIIILCMLMTIDLMDLITIRHYFMETSIKILYPTLYNIIYDDIPYKDFLINIFTGADS